MNLTQFAVIKEVPPIKEKLRHGLKTIAMSNYSNPLEAAIEIIDNSVDELDLQNPPLILNIDIKRDRITFFDAHSLGMGYKELSDFLQWGYSYKFNELGKIGRYGAGGKGAIGYLGTSCEIRTKRKGEDVVWELEGINWRSPELKEFKPEHIKNQFPINTGFTQIDIYGVDKRISPTELANKLSHVYRPLLEDGKIVIKINNKKIEPFKFPLDESENVQEFEEHFKFGTLKGWFGKLAQKSGIRGGIRCYYNGRLITKNYKLIHEFFGYPDPQNLGSMNYLIGELHLDFIPVLPNKTDFNRGSKEWELIEGIMYKKLKPLVEQLKHRKEEIEVTSDDTKNLEEVKNLVISAFSNYEKKELSGPQLANDLDQGRKPPEKRTNNDQKVTKEGKVRESSEERIPRTPPPLNRVGTLLRAQGFPILEIRVGDGLNRAKLISEEGTKKIIIDKSFPQYLVRKGDTLYKAEAVVMQLVKPVSEDIIMLPEEYLDAVDGVMRELSEIYNRKISDDAEVKLEDLIT